MLVIGALYLVWCIVGFFFLGDPDTDLAGRDTNHGPLGLETNALQNLVHVVIGLVALVGASNEKALRVGGGVVLAACLGLAAAGVVGLLIPQANVFSENLAVTVVHAVTALAALVIVLVRVPTPEE